MTVPDAIFGERRLAEIYDDLDPDRGDLEVYAAIVGELGARRVLDIGCGTGILARMLAASGLEVTGVDPAGASLDVARSRVGSGAVRWIEGDAADVPEIDADVALMTANVAQVFVTDESWASALAAAARALRPGGHLVFETRVVAAEIWREWVRERTERVTAIADVGPVRTWTELVSVTPAVVSFRHHVQFEGRAEADAAAYVSDSTLRFRTLPELHTSLEAAGFEVVEVRDAPDRPGREWVVIARLL